MKKAERIVEYDPFGHPNTRVERPTVQRPEMAIDPFGYPVGTTKNEKRRPLPTKR